MFSLQVILCFHAVRPQVSRTIVLRGEPVPRWRAERTNSKCRAVLMSSGPEQAGRPVLPAVSSERQDAGVATLSSSFMFADEGMGLRARVYQVWNNIGSSIFIFIPSS